MDAIVATIIVVGVVCAVFIICTSVERVHKIDNEGRVKYQESYNEGQKLLYAQNKTLTL